MIPKISICIPVHNMENSAYFFKRLRDSIDAQTFTDYEVVVTREGKMAENTNAAIQNAKGEIIKLMYMDDFFFSKDALKRLADTFTGGWYASGCVHTQDGVSFYNPHNPAYNANIRMGNNTIGSPSVVAFENKDPLLFDENLSWLLDCELYGRLYERYGEPTLTPDLDIAIGVGPHQMTNKLTEDEKAGEFTYLQKLYA